MPGDHLAYLENMLAEVDADPDTYGFASKDEHYLQVFFDVLLNNFVADSYEDAVEETVPTYENCDLTSGSTITWTWSTGTTGYFVPNIYNLLPGLYTLTITDNYGWPSEYSFEVESLESFSASTTVLSTSPGLCDGSISLATTTSAFPISIVNEMKKEDLSK